MNWNRLIVLQFAFQCSVFKFFFSFTLIFLNTPSGDRGGPAGGGVMVEVHVGSLHVADL